MSKARILAVIVIGVLVLSALSPGIALSAAPTVGNLSPYNGATDIMLMPTLECTYTANPDLQSAAWWQISTDNAFSNLVWDTGITEDSNDTLEVPRGYLLPETVYYWHVKVQDTLGYWSGWSATWSFTTVKAFAPDQPENLSPADGQDEISPDQRLTASDFYDGDGDAQFASEWQVTSSAGQYGSPLFDSGIDLNNKTVMALPVGLVDYEKTFYWRVRYQDDMGLWSEWSNETSFTVVGNRAPSSPHNMVPEDSATDVAMNPVLRASDFSDSDATAYVGLTDSQAGSQWQVTSTAGVYTSPVWDSGVIGAVTSVTMPAGKLLSGTPYYWHVRYQDSRGNWSGYSEETSFTTKAASIPVASFSVDKTSVTANEELVTLSDNSTPMAEIDRWAWDFGDGATENWTSSDARPPDGEITHKYTQAGTYTVKLTVYNGAKPEGVEQSVVVVVHAKPEASFTLTPTAPKAGKEITFKDGSTPTSDITSWEWQFDDGTTVSWSADERQAADGELTHAFKKSGTHTATLIVKGPLGESYYNKPVNVAGAGGFKFGLWMIGAGVAVVVVIAGLVYLLRARKGK